jgi:jasmonoyl-L-amino acid hydrolase
VDFFEDQSFYPPTVNDARTSGARQPPMMGAEDFSGFYYIGVRNETLGSVHTGHSPYFMVDEDVLPTGAAFHAAVAERFLAEHASLMGEGSDDSSLSSART